MWLQAMLADTSVTIEFPSQISLGEWQTLLFLLVGVIAAVITAREVGHSPGILIVIIIGVLGAILGHWGLSRARTTLGVDLGTGPLPEVLAAIVGALVLVVLARAFVISPTELMQQWRRRYKREVSTRTAEGVGIQIGAQPELVSTATSPDSAVTERRVHWWQTPLLFLWERLRIGRAFYAAEQARLNQEVSRRVEAAVTELRHVQQTQAEAVEERVRAIEKKFPDAAQFQKYADANELFLAFQIGELVKRMDRTEDKQLTRTQVAGIVLLTLVAAVTLTVGLLAIFKAFGVLH